MEWFIIWNALGAAICAWHLGKLFLGDDEPNFADTLFGLCMIPLWPILLWFILGDKK